MDAKYITPNFANLLTINLMVAIMGFFIVYGIRLIQSRGGSEA